MRRREFFRAGAGAGAVLLLGRPHPHPTHTPSPSPSPAPSPAPSPSPSPTPTPGGGMPVNLNPGDNVQAALDANPAGTTFLFSPGTYSVANLVPKSGDILDGGNRAAVLDGGNTAAHAVNGDGQTITGLTIQGFTIQRFNSPQFDGAIQGRDAGNTYWVIQNNHITGNAAAGVVTGDYAQVTWNLLDFNAREGFNCQGTGALYQSNEIAWNNSAFGFDPTVEAGAGKTTQSTSATFRLNNVHDNGGPGLWSDGNNIYTTYDGNVCDNNWGPGIFHEISYDATIINNTVTRNGMPTSPGGGQQLGWAIDAGIQVSTSQALTAASPLLIRNNKVYNNYNGITVIRETGRGSGSHGAYDVRNVLVDSNDVANDQGCVTGLFTTDNSTGVFSQNNHWTGNTYRVYPGTHVSPYNDGWLYWLNGNPDFATWQGTYGNDTTGSYAVASVNLYGAPNVKARFARRKA